MIPVEQGGRATRATVRLTKRAIDQAEPFSKPYFVWDGELRGFGARIDPGGGKTFAVRYRPKGHGAPAPKRFMTRWDQPGSRPVNLGYIMPKYGTIWTDLSSTNVSHELANAYVKDIAAAFGCEVHALPSGNSTPYKHGKPLRLASVKDHLDAWIEPMRRFIAAISEHNGATG